MNASETKTLSSSVVEVQPERREVHVKERLGDKELSKKFTFDRVFGPESTQADVYKTVVSHLIEEVLMGYNCTVFAYGQTGTGKTHTMIGAKSSSNFTWENDPQSGIIPRTLHHLYEALNQLEVEFNVRVSFLELYNEELYDLLAPVNDSSKLRMLKDNGKMGTGSIWVQGLEEKIVHNEEEVFAILEKGTEKRKVGCTLMNDQSSRSHTVFTIIVHIKESNMEGEDLLKIGKLNLVDLAGSECIGKSGAVDRRAREAGNINQSLLTLGRVITALVEKAPHVPYRESKLTRLLQDSLGGRTKTSIIATISPAFVNIEETLSTLDYAHRARNIMNKPEINQKLTKRALIREYTEEIERLRKDLVASRDKNGIFVDLENYEYMQSKISGLSSEVKEKLAQIELLKEERLRTEDLFTMAKTELIQKDRSLNYTTKVLEQTQSELKGTIVALKYSAKELGEQTHLVQHRAVVEEKLTEQAKKLIEVVEETTEHINGLHCKIERKNLLEDSNENHAKSFRQNFRENILNLENSISRIFSNHNELCDGLKKDMSAGLSTQSNLSLEQLKLLQKLTEVLNNHTVVSQLSTEQQTYVSDWTSRNNETNSERVDAVLASQSVFHKDTARHIITELMKTILKQNTMVQEQEKCFKENILSVSNNLESHMEDIHAQFNELKQLEEGIVEENTAQFQRIFERQTRVEEERNAVLKSWNEQRKIILNSLNKTDTFIANHCHLLDSNLPEIAKAVNELEHRDSQRSKDVLKCCNGISLVASNMVEQTKDTMEKQDETLKITLNSIANDRGVIKENCDLIEKAMLNNFNNCQFNLLQVKETLVQENVLLNDEVSAKKMAMTADIEELNVLTGNAISSLQELANKSRKTSDDFIMTQTELHTSLENWNHECKELVVSGFNACDDAVEMFINGELAKDTPTGQTPQRKEYEYPQTLVATSPHENIINRLRMKVSLEPGIKLVLPEETEDLESPNLPLSQRCQSSSSLFGSQVDLSNASASSPKSFTSDISEKYPTDMKENKIRKPRPVLAKSSKLPSSQAQKVLISQNMFITPKPKRK